MMIRSGIRTSAVVLALAGSFAGSATGQTATSTPALREHVTVTSDVVRIGDLVENAGPVADIPVFRSPDLGTTGTVATDRIIDAIRPHQLIDIDTRGLDDVVVTRLSRPISAQDVAARIAQVLSEQNGLGDARDIAVNFDGNVRTLQVEADALGALRVVALGYDQRTSRFDVTFDISGSAALQRHPAHFTGTAYETTAAVTVVQPVERGQVLKESDLTVVRRPKSDTATITDIADAAGLEARRELRPGQPLAATDLSKPAVVQHNDTVTIVYQVPGLVLTLRGQAQEAGALGDSIGVINLETKRVVQGVVTAPGRVTVSAVTTRVVENAASPVVVSPSAPAQAE
jgi:flagellar basal body P-ring formation protein FlgA